VAFIAANKAQPFFVYLAYNAVHSPAQAPAEDIARFKKQFPEITEARAILMAMLHHLDLGVGRVVDTLKQQGVWENTLLFFITDNGGSKAMSAVNTPLRGAKQQNYEGGIRTPFIVSWPAAFKGGRTIATPVTSLDILPTALEAARVALPTDKPLDGKREIAAPPRHVLLERRRRNGRVCRPLRRLETRPAARPDVRRTLRSRERPGRSRGPGAAKPGESGGADEALRRVDRPDGRPAERCAEAFHRRR